MDWYKIILDYSLEGRPSNISKHALKCYCHHIKNARKKIHKSKIEWLSSVKEFSDLVNGDPILRMNWESGIELSGHTLKGKKSREVFEMIDTVCKTPPAFTHHVLVGVPINAIFIEFMQN